MRRRLGMGEGADLFPRVVGHGLGDEPPALVIGGGEAADEQSIAQRGQIGLRHQRRIGDRDVRPWCDPMLRQERRDGRQERVLDGFIRGIAILGFTPDGDSPIDTQGGEDKLLQVWPLVLAIALGDPKGSRLLLGLLGGQIISVDGD